MDHYQVLGVSRDATVQQIRAAYKARVRQVHPDLQGRPGVSNNETQDDDASGAMTAIQLAYTTLTDPAERKLYDNVKPVAGSVAASDDVVLAWLNGLSKVRVPGQTRATKMEDLYHDEQHTSTWSRVQFQDRSERRWQGELHSPRSDGTTNVAKGQELVFDFNALGI